MVEKSAIFSYVWITKKNTSVDMRSIDPQQYNYTEKNLRIIDYSFGKSIVYYKYKQRRSTSHSKEVISYERTRYSLRVAEKATSLKYFI